MASMDTTLADALGRFIPLYNTSCLRCTSTNTILPPFLTNNNTANECKCPGVEGTYVCDDSNDVFTNAQDKIMVDLITRFFSNNGIFS
jgi:hypothetical protein